MRVDIGVNINLATSMKMGTLSDFGFLVSVLSLILHEFIREIEINVFAHLLKHI